MMKAETRAAGVLLHPTSLPGPFGVGDFGPAAEQFLDWARDAGLRLWQVLPLFPPGAGHSPYSARSTFAGSPLLISPERLVEAGLLPGSALDNLGSQFDHEHAWRFKEPLLREAWRTFRGAPPASVRHDFERFADEAPAQLNEWLLFAPLRRRFEGRGWIDWPEPLRDRDAAALKAARREMADEIEFERFLQFLFFHQWLQVRRKAKANGIQLIGDLPIYVAFDSSDVWANRELFELDETGQPTAVAGVPPDYFSEDGQLWGNPLYRWDRMAETGFAWWVARVRASLGFTDLLRLDHFRGFEAYWRVPIPSPQGTTSGTTSGATPLTAAQGAWVPGPGKALFEALRVQLDTLPLLAEDLGDLSPAVHELRAEIGLPGMKVLQFAFADEESEHLPKNHRPSDVAYTGTHDNNTLRGWFESAPEEERQRALRLTVGDAASIVPGSIVWGLIDAVYGSPAERVVVPMQDFLELGSEARMNTPGTAHGNWSWRLSEEALPPALAARLRRLAERHGRL